jgi:hypothetical protein
MQFGSIRHSRHLVYGEVSEVFESAQKQGTAGQREQPERR